MESIPLQAIEPGQVYCIFVPHRDLLVGRVTKLERESPMSLIEIESRIYTRQ